MLKQQNHTDFLLHIIKVIYLHKKESTFIFIQLDNETHQQQQ